MSIDTDMLFDKFGDKICDYCQKYIICGPAMTQFYMCEGSRCHDALDSMLENDTIFLIEIKKLTRLQKLDTLNDICLK